MKARITAIRPFDSYADVELVSLDLTNDEGAVFNVIVSAESTEVLIPVMESDEVRDVPDWLLLPFPLFDPVDA